MTDMEQLDNSRTLPNLQKTGLDDSNRQLNKSDYVAHWISQAEFDDTSSEASSFVYTSSVVDSEEYLEDMKKLNIVDDKDSTSLDTNSSSSGVLKKIEQVFNTQNNIQAYGSNQSNTVNINTASGPVHIGNVTYITGPVHITDTQGGHIGVINQEGGGGITLSSVRSHHHSESEQNVRISGESVLNQTTATTQQSRSPPTVLALDDQLEEDERAEVNSLDAFVGDINRNIAENLLNIIERRTWLAQQPLEPYNYIEGPVPYVIISHTATELTRTQAETIYMVRHIQCFHIESCRWNDIGYNFLVGGDGNVYEGRGWGVVGAHTRGYNKKAIGISFIGCFMRALPPRESMIACKLLIKRGIELGFVDPNYKLLGHCQCYGTESPGKRLFEEIKTWSHFAETP